MASAHNSSDFVESLAGYYGEHVEASEQVYPGLYEQDLDDDPWGEFDLLVAEDDETLRAYEIKEVNSLNQRTILSNAFGAKRQCDRMEEYLSSLGYNVETEYIIKPEGHLKAVSEIWENLPKIFEIESAKEAVSEPGRIPYITEKAMEEVEENQYRINEELTPVLEAGIIQP